MEVSFFQVDNTREEWICVSGEITHSVFELLTLDYWVCPVGRWREWLRSLWDDQGYQDKFGSLSSR